MNPKLTPREIDVLRLIAEGLSSAEVAGQLGISKRTVDWRLRRAYQRLKVVNRVQALRHPMVVAALASKEKRVDG